MPPDAFPFDVLHRSVEECRAAQPIRVVITDRDFDANYESRPENPRIFAGAVRASPHFVLLLHLPVEGRAARYRVAGAKVVPVLEMEDFPRMAAALSRALFEEGRHGDR